MAAQHTHHHEMRKCNGTFLIIPQDGNDLANLIAAKGK